MKGKERNQKHKNYKGGKSIIIFRQECLPEKPKRASKKCMQRMREIRKTQPQLRKVNNLL